MKKLKTLVDEEKIQELKDYLQEDKVANVDIGQLMEEIQKIDEEVIEAKKFKAKND